MKQGEASQKARVSVYRLAGLAAGVLAAPIGLAQQPVAQRVLAVSGQAAPGTEGGTVFGWLGLPGIGARGDVAFDVSLGGPAVNSYTVSSLWLVPGGTASPVLAYRGTDSANQYPATTFSERVRWGESVDANGQVAFTATVNSVPVVMVGTPGHYRIVAREGDAVPGLPTGVKLRGFLEGRLTRTGDVYFESRTDAISGNITPYGSFVSTGGAAPQVVAYTGGPADGVPGLKIVSIDGTAGAGGHVAFLGGTNSSDRVQDARGIWSGTAGNMTRIAYSGMVAPDLPPFPGVTGDLRMHVFTGPPGTNSSGATVFSADLLTPAETLYPSASYLYDHGQLTLLGALGTPVPASGEGRTLYYARSKRVTDRGEALIRGGTFRQNSGDPGVEGWYRWRSGVVTPIVEDGVAAPRLGAGVTLTKTSVVSFNEAGQALLTATLAGPAMNSTNNASLWAVDPLGQFTLVARAGSSLVVEGAERVVSAISAWTTDYGSATPGSFPAPAALSDSGQAAYWVSFTDGSSANLLATLPSVIAGDVNNDLVVDLKDFDVLYRHLGQAGDRAVGDLDYDGVVGFTDYQVFQRNFGRSVDGGGAVMAVPEAVAALVPEPVGVGVIGLGAALLGGRRRRRGGSAR